MPCATICGLCGQQVQFNFGEKPFEYKRPKEFQQFQPVWKWVETYVGTQEIHRLCHVTLCLTNVFSTTRDSIRARPWELYERLLREAQVGGEQEAEVEHFMERLVQLIYGQPTVPPFDDCPPLFQTCT